MPPTSFDIGFSLNPCPRKLGAPHSSLSAASAVTPKPTDKGDHQKNSRPDARTNGDPLACAHPRAAGRFDQDSQPAHLHRIHRQIDRAASGLDLIINSKLNLVATGPEAGVGERAIGVSRRVQSPLPFATRSAQFHSSVCERLSVCIDQHSADLTVRLSQ